MIKVLRKGTRKQIECENCGALLQYEETDIIKEELRFNEYVKYITCPQCFSNICVEATR